MNNIYFLPCFCSDSNDILNKFSCLVYTQPVRDVPGTSPEGPNVRDLQGTLRGPTQKSIIEWKRCFLDAIVLVLHIRYCFLLEKQICKSSKWGRPRDVPGTRWWAVLGTSPERRSYMFFKFNSETYLTYFDRLLETL